MSRRLVNKRATADVGKRRDPASLIEYLRTAQPLDVDFPEIEDYPPEQKGPFDDWVDFEPNPPDDKQAK